MKVLLVSVLVLSVVCAQIGAERTISGGQCRKGFPCGRHGQVYKWCWTSVNEERWDFCCNSACTQYENYYWCYIDERNDDWRKCLRDTTASRVTVNGGFSCRGDHPCGRHSGTSYYWCYTDLTDDDDNWDLCCQAGHACGLNGQNYDWCWIGGTYKDSNWRYCTMPL